MDILIGVIIYLIILAGLMMFGKFLHECDEVLKDQFRKGQKK